MTHTFVFFSMFYTGAGHSSETKSAHSIVHKHQDRYEKAVTFTNTEHKSYKLIYVNSLLVCFSP